MSFASLLERSCAYGARFAIAARNLGFGSAVQTFMWVRRGSGLRSVYAARLGRRVFFRSGSDKGVMSHFFHPGTRILDTPEVPVRVIVDAGANAGMETIRLRHFHPAAHVLSIEAAPGNYAVLQKNAESHGGFVQTTLNGVWSSEASLRVVPGAGNEAFSVRPAEAGEKADIEAITMNAILARVGGEIDILKMDIEGAEYEVFSKNTEWATHVKAFIIEFPDGDHPGAVFQIFRALEDQAFDVFTSGENLVLIRRDTGWKVSTTAYL